MVVGVRPCPTCSNTGFSFHGLNTNQCFFNCNICKHTADHLFATCCYTQEVWHAVSRMLSLQCPAPSPGLTVIEWWLQKRLGMNKPKKKGLDSTFMLISWKLWKERNDRVFSINQTKTVAQLIYGILEEAQLWIEAGAKHMVSLGWTAAVQSS